MLTGSPVFTGESVMDICMKHVQEIPEPPSARLGKPISPELEKLILRCLAKEPGERPADAAELLRELDEHHADVPWTAEDAAAWWAQFGRTLADPAARPPAPLPSPAQLTPPAADKTISYQEQGGRLGY